MNNLDIGYRPFDIEIDRNFNEHRIPVSSSEGLIRGDHSPYGFRRKNSRDKRDLDTIIVEETSSLLHPEKIIPLGNIPKGFRTHRFSCSLPHHEGWYWRWVVLSKGKRSKVLRYLFSKWIWDELTRVEMVFLMDNQDFLQNQYMIACFRIANLFGKKKLREYLSRLYTILPKEFVFLRSEYIGLKSLCISFRKEGIQSPNHPKFSGWRRHQRVAKGSPEGSPKWDDLLLGSEFEDETPSINWFKILSSVGESDRLILRGMYLSLKSLNKGETESS